MSEHVLAVEERNGTGKGVARKLRATGMIPGVYYGGGADPKPVQLNAHDLVRLLSTSSAGMNTLIDLSGGGELDGKVVLVKELQRDPVNGRALHADLYAVDVDRAVTVSVPVHLDGTAAGVKMGGIVDHALREVELECLPRAIPEELRVDISALDLGDSLHVRDIPLPEGVELLTDGDLSLVSVVQPRAEEEEAPAEEEGEEGAEAAAEGEAPAEGAAPAEGGGDEAKSDD
ncbi:MAG: 50S ribosomal protein L25 [Myxococcota bacterium]